MRVGENSSALLVRVEMKEECMKAVESRISHCENENKSTMKMRVMLYEYISKNFYSMKANHVVHGNRKNQVQDRNHFKY